jgi:hypothetical protein
MKGLRRRTAVLGIETVTNVLYALATGDFDRASNLVATSEGVDDVERGVLLTALVASDDRSANARHFGDALRALGADFQFVNECYRAAFYTGEDWERLTANPLFALFESNRGGYPLDKWPHYFPIYDDHLRSYRGLPVRVLEIGVYRGGGLAMLRHYLGDQATFVGIDIDSDAKAAARGYTVELGDQADPEFLRRVSEAHGPFDIVIDDGGHTMRQQITSVETLFPLLNAGGVYIVEDCHTSYWPEYADQGAGGLTFMDWVKARLDDVNAYHFSRERLLTPPWQTDLGGVHVYDSIVALTRQRHVAPFCELNGDSQFVNFPRQEAANHLEILAARDAAVARAETVERDLRAQLASAQTDLAAARAEVDGSRGAMAKLERSKSWRATSPVRRLKSIFRRR